jgi:hypothetical protein
MWRDQCSQFTLCGEASDHPFPAIAVRLVTAASEQAQLPSRQSFRRRAAITMCAPNSTCHNEEVWALRRHASTKLVAIFSHVKNWDNGPPYDIQINRGHVKCHIHVLKSHA